MGAPARAPNPRRSSPPAAPWAPRIRLERETGFEPATPSLEGWRSTAELFPQHRAPNAGATAGRTVVAYIGATTFSNRPPTTLSVRPAAATMVGRGGFEPPKAYASRF